MKKLLLLLAFSVPASAQLGNVTLLHFTGVPTGACTSNQQAVNDATGDLYTCLTGSWHAAGTSTGTGTLTNFSAGTGAPLFTTSVATPTTTPALTFTASNAAANTAFGNFTGAPAAPTFTAAPTFSAANLTNFPIFNQNTTGTAAALTATPTNCGAGSAAIGILANGNATGCFTPSGAGTVTTFSAGNLSPLFTSNVATATSTPALTFTLSTPAANTVFGNFTGAPAAPTFTAAPTFSAANLTSFPTFNQNTTGTASNLSGTPALPNGTTATTQTAGDNTTKIATDAFVIANSSGSLPSGPTSPNGVPSVLTSTPSAGVAGAAAYSLGGVPVNNNSETTCATQTLNVLDRATSIFCSGGSTSIFTLPVHTTSGFGVNFPMVIYNGNSGNMTLTPTTDTIDRGTLLPSWSVFAYNNASGNWQSNQFPTYNAFGTTCTNGSTWSTTTGFGCLSAAPVKSGDAAGGDLTGTYPSPTIAANAVTQTKVLNGYVDLSSNQASIAGNKTFTGVTTTGNLSTIRIVDGTHFAATMAGIQAAHDDLPAGGGIIILPAGTYNGTATIAFTKPVILEGAGKDVSIIQLTTTGSFLFALTSTTSLTVRNMTFNAQTQPTTNLNMEAIRIDNTSVNATGMQLLIENVRATGFNTAFFADGRNTALTGVGFDRVILRNDDCKNAPATGAPFPGECAFLGGADVTLVESCTFDENSSGDHTVYEINVNNAIVRGNVLKNIVNTGSNAVKLTSDHYASGQVMPQWAVENNTIINAAQPILLFPGRITGDNPVVSKVIIRGNLIEGTNSAATGDAGIHIAPANSSVLRTIEILDNYMNNVQQSCILIDSQASSSISEQITIRDLTCRDFGVASSGTYSAITNNSVGPITNLVLDNIKADGTAVGRNAYGLTTSVITRLQISNISEVNVTGPASTPTYGYGGSSISGTLLATGEGTAPTAAASTDVCYGDSTAHSLKCSYNNGAFSNIPLTGLTNVFSVSQTFTAGLQTGASPPACTAGTAGFICNGEGTAPTNVASTDAIYADSTTHEFMAATAGASAATPGMMVRVQPSPVNLTAQTAAKTTTALCAASAGACNTAGQYRVSWNFWGSGTACSSVTAGSVTFLLTWTDANAITHSAVALPMTVQTGAATTATQSTFPFQTALANESAGGDFTISTNGSVINYATGYTACTTGTGTYNLRASVMRIQ